MSVDPVSGSIFSRPGGNGAVAGPPGMRAAHADRERAVDVLKAGFAESRITKAEYDDRAARVAAARTYGELGALIADLPAGPLGGQPSYPSVGDPPRQPAHTTTRPLAGLILGYAGIGLLAFMITLMIVAVPRTGHVVHAVVIPPAHSVIVIPPAPGPPQGGQAR